MQFVPIPVLFDYETVGGQPKWLAWSANMAKCLVDPESKVWMPDPGSDQEAMKALVTSLDDHHAVQRAHAVRSPLQALRVDAPHTIHHELVFVSPLWQEDGR